MCVLDTDKQILDVWEIEINPKQKNLRLHECGTEYWQIPLT